MYQEETRTRNSLISTSHLLRYATDAVSNIDESHNAIIQSTYNINSLRFPFLKSLSQYFNCVTNKNTIYNVIIQVIIRKNMHYIKYI